MRVRPGLCLLLLMLFFCGTRLYAQNCSTLGQSPATAFPVCGTTTFVQTTVPLCNGGDLFVPGCTGDNADYANRNPFWYKFTCYQSGTLGFTIDPADAGDDYDWQLYDITGLDPNQVFTNRNIIVSGNWAGNPGPTGANATGADFIQCASAYVGNEPRFARMPELVLGHEYLLLVSHFTDSQSGYSLNFNMGTALITDPKMPEFVEATPNCDGKQVEITFNKKLKCSSLTAAGTEFTLVPAISTVIAAQAANCNSSFEFDALTLTFANNLPAGNYQVVMKRGSDNNTLLDNCDNEISSGDQVAFTFVVPTPIPIDSVAKVGCAPNSVKLHFSKRIDCSTIATDGSNFQVTGPTPVVVQFASGNCVNGLSDVVTIHFTNPIYTKGTYTVIPKLSVGGGAVRDECGQVIQPQPVSFSTADTVSAAFTYNMDMGCRFDTINFAHSGGHDVNSWNWVMNSNTTVTTPAHQVIWPASSTHTVALTVTNGVCSDTKGLTLVLNNEVKANFEMPDVICPEDPLALINTSTGLIDHWRWSWQTGNTNLQTPQPIQFPMNNNESNYIVKLVATNQAIGCSDSISKSLKVLDNCFIAVPSAFTPNNDGLNDYLRPNNAIKAADLEFKVYNRWGQLVFQSRNWQDRWDGKLKGITQSAGVYVWFLNYTHADTGKKVFQKGTTTLIR